MKMPCATVVGESCDAALTISINIIIINEAGRVRTTNERHARGAHLFPGSDGCGHHWWWLRAIYLLQAIKGIPSYRRRRRNYSTMCPYSHQIRRATRRNRWKDQRYPSFRLYLLLLTFLTDPSVVFRFLFPDSVNEVVRFATLEAN